MGCMECIRAEVERGGSLVGAGFSWAALIRVRLD